MTLLQIKLSTFVKQINTKLIWTVKKHEKCIKLKTEKRVQTLTSKKKLYGEKVHFLSCNLFQKVKLSSILDALHVK